MGEISKEITLKSLGCVSILITLINVQCLVALNILYIGRVHLKNKSSGTLQSRQQ